jgi:hypothetical protein
LPGATGFVGHGEEPPERSWPTRPTGAPTPWSSSRPFHLVLGTIVLAQAALDREALLHALFSAHLASGLEPAAGAGPDGPAAGSSPESRLATLRDAVATRVSELRAVAAARAQVERTYLDGQPALFPATVRGWAEQLERTEQLAALAIRLAELDGLAPAPAPDPEAFAARVEQLVADHVEPTRVKALDEMDEGYARGSDDGRPHRPATDRRIEHRAAIARETARNTALLSSR